jgi:hypothetical protein
MTQVISRYEQVRRLPDFVELSPLYRRASVKIAETFAVNLAAHIFETSVFSGWSTWVGVQAPFQICHFFTRPFGGSNPTTIKCTIRENTFDGTILAEKTIPYNRTVSGLIAATEQVVEFDSVIQSSQPLIFQWEANGNSSLFGRSSTVLFPVDSSRYATNGTQTGVWSDVTGATEYQQWVAFHLRSGIPELAPTGLTEIRSNLAYTATESGAAKANVIMTDDRNVIATPIAEGSASFQFELSSFSGWSTESGIVSGTISGVRFRVREHSGNVPTTVRVTVREGSRTGTILADKTVPWTDRDADGYLRVLFDNTFSSTQSLWIQYQTNGRAGFYGGLSGSAAAGSTWFTTFSLQNFTWGDNPSDHRQWVQWLGTTPTPQLTAAGQLLLGQSSPPRLNLAPVYYAVQGEPLELFHRGIVEAINPYQYDIQVVGASLGPGGSDPTEARNYPRYVQIQPASTGTRTLTYSVHSQQNTLLRSTSASVIVVNRTAGPAANTRVLCLGDSLTAGAGWTTEARRRLVGTGGTPAGKEFTNFEFIGSKGTSPNKHEGNSGYAWQTYNTDGTSPLFNAGVLDWDNYITVSCGVTGVEQVYVLLGWNAQTDTLRTTAADWAADIAVAKTVIDGLHADFPSCKVTLMGLQVPSPIGGLATNYGDSLGAFGKYWQLLQNANGWNLACRAWVAEPAYSNFMDYIDLASQFDSEFNQPFENRAVNSRNAATERIGTNGIHPAAEGQLQIGDAVYRHLMGKWCV